MLTVLNRKCEKLEPNKFRLFFWRIICIDDYRLHTSCITEAERYEKTAAKPKKTKRNPQQEWMDIVEACASSAPSHLRDHMLTMSSLDNIPRKEKQFVNFASNSLRLHGSNKAVVSEIWSLLRGERERRIAEKEKKELLEKEKKEQEKKEKEKQQQREKTEPVTKPEEKQSPSSCNGNKNDDSISAKKVKKIAKKTLEKAPKKSMRIKELRKIIKREMGLPKSAKKQLKLLLLETAKTSKNRIKIDGKLMSLS